MGTKKKIVILFHGNSNRKRVSKYYIHSAAKTWEQDGHEVQYLFGVRDFVAADLCFMHVDLSVVPQEYIDFSDRYPLTVNKNIVDITKRAISNNLLNINDKFDGQVIVKTDQNYAGWPELLHSRSRWVLALLRAKSRVARGVGRFTESFDYRIFPDLNSVPDKYLVDDQYVVEKFLPERRDGKYVIHGCIFLGNTVHGFVETGNDPIVKARSIVTSHSEEPHPDVLRWRKDLEIDFGKLDYTMVDGKPVLLDVNKTFGMATASWSQKYNDKLTERARGLYDYF